MPYPTAGLWAALADRAAMLEPLRRAGLSSPSDSGSRT
jgi:hypothetical protein